MFIEDGGLKTYHKNSSPTESTKLSDIWKCKWIEVAAQHFVGDASEL